MTRIIAVISGKGGVGKTTSVSNIGAALTDFGRKVILVDGNITTPNLNIHLGLPKTKYSLNDVLRGKISIKEALYTDESGIKVLPSGISFSELKKKFKKSLRDEIIDLVGEADIILIDSPAGLDNNAESAIAAATEVLIVVNPNLPSVTDALKASLLAKEYGVRVIGFIITRYEGTEEELPIENIREFLGMELIGIVPESRFVKKSLREHEPVVFKYPECEASTQYKKIAAEIIGEKYERFKERKSIFKKILDWFKS